MVIDYIKDAAKTCELMGWDKGWSKGGCYIHLEVSEFIEALRGKGDPLDELGDVLFALLFVADHYGLDSIEAMEQSKIKLMGLTNKK